MSEESPITHKIVTEYGCVKSDSKLDQYIVDHSLRLSEAQKWILKKTKDDPKAYYLMSSIEMQLLANLCYAINAKKTLDVGKYHTLQ
ncbi:unnamed protein product [Trichobilharzia regenti]|nr:unnamed protein product [Trichobilharzia regenti]